MPLAATASSVGTSRLTTTGARPSESSSTSTTLGCETSAWASTTICCSPPESSRPGCPALLELGEELEGVRDAALRVLRGSACTWQHARLSSTVSAGSSRLPSGTTATPAARTLLGPAAREVAISEHAPCRGARAKHSATARTSVDLPAPLGPRSAVTSPGAISMETSATTVRPPRGRTAPRGGGSATGGALSAHSDLLGSEVRPHHVLVPQDVRRRPGRDQPAEVEHRRRLATRRDEAHVVVDENRQRAEVTRGSS